MEGVGFVVEAPGAANPLSFQELCRVLQSTISHNAVSRSSAGEQLAEWEGTSGFLLTLQSVFLDRSLPLEIRLQAIIQLKNNVNTAWRLLPHIRHGISPEEKASIRSRLFQGAVVEEDKTLALHSALVAAKIVRIDFPTNNWATALGDLVGLIRTYRRDHPSYLGGVLQILLRVTKELTTIRIRKGQGSLQSMTPEICFLLAEIYTENVRAWMSHLQSGQHGVDATDQAMINSLLSLKTIRRLFISGYEYPHHDKTVQEFWALSQHHLGQMIESVSHDSRASAPSQEEVGKHLLQFTKLHLEMAYNHPASFAILPDSLPLVHAYWNFVAKFSQLYDNSGGIRVLSSLTTTDPGSKSKVDGPILERLALKGLLILRACVKIAFQPVLTFKYRSVDVKEEQQRASFYVKQELFTPALVVQITNALVSRLFVFRKADLESWEESPEEWENQEQSESGAYEWEVRPCAQRLFLELLTNFKKLLMPPLLAYFESATNPDTDIATKEAVYTALGIAAPHVKDRFSFDTLLHSTIISDAQMHGPLAKVLRRRIAILVSQWVAVDASEHSRLLVYELFRHLMNPKDDANDDVVRITAARQLKWVADDLEFDKEAFLPFAGDVLSWMLALVQDVSVDETKLAILESVRLVVTRLEEEAARFGDLIMTALPQIWGDVGDEEYMIKQAVIAIFNALVAATGNRAQRYHHLMIPLLTEAATPGTSLHMHLIDESLELWNTMLIHSKSPLSPELVSLAQLSLPILEFASPTATQALEAIESYILLGPEAMLADALRRPTIRALADIILHAKSREQVHLATSSVEYLIRSAVDLGGTEGLSVILRDMMDTTFLPKVLEKVYGAWEAHQTIGPHRRLSDLNVLTQGDMFAILARIALADPTLFSEMLAAIHNASFSHVWKWLGDEWFSFQSSTDSIERQKLYLLGLTRLLEVAPIQQAILGNLQGFVSMWNSVILELQDGVRDAQDSLIWMADDAEELAHAEYQTCKSLREREVGLTDPVHAVSALNFVAERIQAVVSRVGDARFNGEWAVNVDREVLEKFQLLTGI